MLCVHAAALEVFQIYTTLHAIKWREKYLKGFYTFFSKYFLVFSLLYYWMLASSCFSACTMHI